MKFMGMLEVHEFTLMNTEIINTKLKKIFIH